MKTLTYIEIDVPSFVSQSPAGTETFRFAIPSSYLPNDIECIPSIDNVSLTPMRISLGQDLGQRADLKITFRDHLHVFNGEPYDQGTFWGKWRGRYGLKLRGCPVRLIRGYVGQTIDQMEIRYYLCETTNGPTPDAVYTIEAKDVLKFADDDRAQAPVLSNGSLAGSINNSTTTAILSPTGIGDLEYPSSGWVCFGGKEVVSFTRVSDTLTITRAQFGSEAQAHDAGDRVQLVLRYTGNTVAEIIYDLLTEYAAVPASYITLTDWESEVADHLGAVLYARTISEPTSVKKLLSEIVEQAALALYWDDRAQQVRLTVLREIDTTTGEFTHDNIIEGTLKVSEQPLKRISQIWTFYGQRDPTDTAANEDNFRAALADVDLATESEYGSPEIRKIQAAWIETESAASRLNAIQLSRFRDPPRLFAFDLIAGTSVTPAAGYTVRWWANQNELGEEVPAEIQVTQVAFYADRIHIEAEEMLASGDLPTLVNTIFLTDVGALGSLTVPATWNSADNTIACIGGGAGGSFASRTGGGGGGAYSHKTNVTLTPGASVPYRVGDGGPAYSDGEDTWFGNALYASATVAAKGGDTGSGRFGGTGGLASEGIGDVRYSGGSGGQSGPSGDSGTGEGGGGGGGAAGPHGDGGNGGSNTFTDDDSGAGGGGADGGSDGSKGNRKAGGGNGGNNRFNFGGGTAGSSGDEGGGGGGGDPGAAGGPGGAGEQFWTQTINPIVSAGPGGGGGGGGDDARGGNGGLYGGGGGGGDSTQSGDGAQGIIVLTWREPT